MSRRPISAKIDTGISKSAAIRQVSNLSRKSSQTASNKPTNVPVSLRQRPKSASHCCGATDSPPKRPWSNSVLIDNKSSAGSSPNRKLGYIPSYIRKRRSSASMDQAKIEDRLEDETPPPLVPSEQVHQLPERRLLRQRTFNQKEREQLEEALKELTEEKKMLEAQNQWLKEESESRLQIIGTESERNKQLEVLIREMSEEMALLRSERETAKEGSVDESSSIIEDRVEQINVLQVENEFLRKELEELRSKSVQEIVDNKEDAGRKRIVSKKIGLLQRDLEKYRMARKKLKEIIQTLMVENHRLRASIGNHCFEGTMKENSVEEEQLVNDIIIEEVASRVDLFDDLRREKRTRQKLIEVKKYKS